MEQAPQIVNHHLIGARQLSSPHHDDRPLDEVNAVVIHCISLPPGNLAGTKHIEELFADRVSQELGTAFPDLVGLAVSAHILIARDGKFTQFVPFDKRAWHAGASTFAGCSGVNDFAIGIELQGEEATAYTPAQYQNLAALLVALLNQYPDITLSRIVGHCDVAPGRKSDPGVAFQWEYLLGLVGEGQKARA